MMKKGKKCLVWEESYLNILILKHIAGLYSQHILKNTMQAL